MRTLIVSLLLCIGCPREQTTGSTPTPTLSPPRPASVPQGSPDKDPLEKLRRAGSVYRISKDKEDKDACVQWFFEADKEQPSKGQEAGRLFISSVDYRGVTVTAFYNYRYSFVDSYSVHETLPGFGDALNAGMTFEEAQLQYGRDLTRVWWMELLGPSIEMSSGPGGGSIGCAEGHPIQTRPNGVISFGEEFWFPDQTSCQEALQDPKRPKAPRGC